VALPGQEFFGNVQLLAEVLQFVVLGFKIFVLQLRQDKFRDNEPGSKVFEGMGTAVAKVLPADGHLSSRARQNPNYCRHDPRTHRLRELLLTLTFY
jgi:hypothetical protein